MDHHILCPVYPMLFVAGKLTRMYTCTQTSLYICSGANTKITEFRVLYKLVVLTAPTLFVVGKAHSSHQPEAIGCVCVCLCVPNAGRYH